jgi:lipopolysaccharide transport system ATP-binding protein
MSSEEFAIRAEDLGKEYAIAHERRPSHQTLVETIAGAATAPLRRLRRFRGTDSEIERFWALREVSFDIREGEVVGIIGRNGAGKSTLLKILSKITAPSTGRAVIRGRVGSLLEVGTGFHPELTGRENIFLNGAILGMKKEEIRRKLDAIIAFAEVERFIDTPVKRYSSGMYVRLAFSVAAHLEPEILLVDEVLAVGDASFQKRCLGKMSEVAREGRTVVFVSHNLPTVLSLTERCIWIDKGRIAADADPQTVVHAYLKALETSRVQSLASREDRTGSGDLRFTGFSLRNARGEEITTAISGDDLVLALHYRIRDGAHVGRADVSIGVHGSAEQRLFHLSTTLTESLGELPSVGTIVCRIPHLPLMPGTYAFNLFGETDGGIADWIQHAGEIDVAPGDFFGSGKLPPPTQGLFLVSHSWAVER